MLILGRPRDELWFGRVVSGAGGEVGGRLVNEGCNSVSRGDDKETCLRLGRPWLWPREACDISRPPPQGVLVKELELIIPKRVGLEILSGDFQQ